MENSKRLFGHDVFRGLTIVLIIKRFISKNLLRGGL